MRTKNEYDRFPFAKRGYDPQSVEAFIELAAADNDRMLNEAAARIAALESELEEAKRQEEAVHLTIQAATKTKDDIIAAARHQAGELVANGRKEGDRIVTEARMQAFQLVTGARKEAETRKSIDTLDGLAWALYRAGAADEAAPVIDAALAHGTRDARLLYHAGAIKVANDDIAGGKALIDKALALNPRFDYSEATEARALLATLSE